MKTSIVMVGIGGYSGNYVNAIEKWAAPRDWEIVAVVDPMAEKAFKYDVVQSWRVPIYSCLDDFYRRQHADLAVISSPIQYHCEQSCEAVSHETNVLCEKPLCAVIQDAHTMKQVLDTHPGRFIAIGYQWSFSPQIQSLKADILKGVFGAPKRLKTLVLWPRSDGYYGRNNWAGCQKTVKGEWILDSPVNNATAHYLHNMLYVLGPRVDRSVQPLWVQAELYRANPISNYDTAFLRVMTEGNVELLFYTSHAVNQNRGPEFVYEFEEGTVYYDSRQARMWAELSNGTIREYGEPDSGVEGKFREAIRATRGESEVVCGLEAAMMQTLCMNGAQDSIEEIQNFPLRDIYGKGVYGNRVNVMTGLAERISAAYDHNLLPGEDCPAGWTTIGRKVDLMNYSKFTG